MLHTIPLGIVSSTAAAYLLEQSLLFDGAAYLSRTPGSAGNTKTFTIKMWVKIGTITDTRGLSGAASGGGGTDQIRISTTGSIEWYMDVYNGVSNIGYLTTSSLYRDFSGWQLLTFIWDTTQATAADRMQIWVGLTRLTAFATSSYPSLNADATGYMNTVPHRFGCRSGLDNFYHGYMASLGIIDGSGVTPDGNFAEVDAEGYINPIEYTGSYGTNGGAYDFADSSNFGLDVNNTVTGAATYTHTDAAVQGVSATPWTTGSLSIGAADSDRNIVVTIASNGNASNITKVEIDSGSGYVDMTVVKQYDSANPNGGGSCFALLVTAGTTATFRITGAGAKSIDVYRCIGMDISKFWFGTNSSDPMTTTVYCPAGGVVFGIAAAYAASLASVVWTGLVADTDHGPMTSGEDSGFSASSAFATVQDKLTVTCDPNVAVSERTLLVVAFGPTGVGNDFETSGFVSTDQLADTPTDDATLGIGNYTTLNPNNNGGSTLSEGNTKIVSAGGGYSGGGSTIYASSGKFYWEVTIDAVGGGGEHYHGVVPVGYPNTTSTARPGYSTDSWGIVGDSGVKKVYNSIQTTIAGTTTWSVADVLMIALDLDNGKMWFGENGTWYDSGDPAAGTGEQHASVSGTLTPAFSVYATGEDSTYNFGAKGFTYTPPTGFSVLATQNLPASTIDVPSDYMNTVLYTGNGTAIGSGGNAITGVGFQPDFVWMKSRSAATDHALYDSVRGTTKEIISNSTAAESTLTEGLTAFGTDGFTLGSDAAVNTNAATYVAWCWKAGGTAASNTDGSITSSVSANPTSGFSIVSYTGTAANATVGHGLGVAPSLMIVKNRTDADAWAVYHSANTAAPETDYLVLNTTAATADLNTYWNDTAPTTSVFSIGSVTNTNGSTDAMIAYCWAEVEGFSKFGSYTGNGSAAGPFIYTGFRPALVIIKNASGTTQGWQMFDNKRSSYNVTTNYIMAHSSDAEATGNGRLIDMTSNGLKIRASDNSINISAGLYIYAAFAEFPFQGGAGSTTQGRAR
jgi:hypothetical protein